jgi:hypothetical protein
LKIHLVKLNFSILKVKGLMMVCWRRELNLHLKKLCKLLESHALTEGNGMSSSSTSNVWKLKRIGSFSASSKCSWLNTSAAINIAVKMHSHINLQIFQTISHFKIQYFYSIVLFPSTTQSVQNRMTQIGTF